MKLIVYVLSALLLFSCVSAGGSSSKQDLTTSDLENDSNVQDALKYGVNWIFEQAAKKYGISNLNVDITQVNTIQKWKENGDTYYYFDCEAHNDDATINCTFNVKCDSKGGLSIVNKWNYNIDQNNNEHSGSYDTETELESTDAGTNVEIDVEVDVETEAEAEVEVVTEEEEDNNKCAKGDQVDASNVDTDSNLKDALDYGVNWIFQQAAKKYGISDKDCGVDKINCICKWEDNGNTYYSFDVEASNNDATITTTFEVKCDSKGNESVVGKWNYNIDKKNHEEETDNNTDVKVDVEVEVEVVTEEEDSNKCENIAVSEIDNDDHLKAALVHGINWIFQKAHDKFDISTEDIVVTKVNNLCGWEDNGSNYYSFDVEATNKDGDTVDTSFYIRCDSNGDLRVVNEWKYVIHYGDHKQEENNDNCEDQGTDTYENLEQDVEVDVEVTVSKCQQGDEVDASEVNNDSDLKDALAYGIGWIFQNAANKYGVSDDSVEVDQINCICKWEDNGRTYYSFDVEATNNNDASVNATFNVKCEDDGSFDVVNKWWYHIEYSNNTEDKNDDCGSTEEQANDSYQNNEQDVEVTVEINIENCQEDDNNTNSYNTDNNNKGNYNN